MSKQTTHAALRIVIEEVVALRQTAAPTLPTAPKRRRQSKR
ncbi:MAG: hypothetical protein RMK49_19695 [Abditibacteriales bacterium]|nr:hypothetical protein [Abditibacteriales bacterium]